MRWVRIRAEFPRYAGGGPAPTFDITSDDDGVVNVEIAVRPEVLVAPVSSDPPQFFSSASGSAPLGVLATEVRLRNGRATYTLPQRLWASLVHQTQTVSFRAVASTTPTGAPVIASHGDDDCLRGYSGSFQVLQMSAAIPAEPLTVPAESLALVPDRHRRTLDGIIAVAGTRDRLLLAEVLVHDAFLRAAPAQQAGVMDLFARTDSPGRAMVVQLLDLGVQTGSNIVEPGLFMKDECNEATLLDHLLALHDARLHRRVRARRAEIVREAIREIVDPGLEINQGNAGTCTVTSVTAYTATRNPAELARWMRHLFDADSRFRCPLARNGVLRLDTRAFSATSFSAAGDVPDFFARSYTERVLQAALMDYGNFREKYDPRTDNFIDWAGKVCPSGLWDFEVTRILESVFAEPFRWDYGGGTGSAPVGQVAADRLVAHLRNGGLPVVLVTSWGANKSGAHAMIAVRAEGTDIVFRNPQYRGSLPSAADGTLAIDPPRRIVSAARAEEAIALVDLREWILGFCAESGSTDDFGYSAAEIPTQLKNIVQPTAA